MSKAEQQPIVSPDIKKPRETLNDAELNGFLSSVGNHEGKALLLSSMKPEVTYGYLNLNQLTRISGQKVWAPAVPFNWCMKSLAPIGLVARELIDQERGTVGYEITEKGKMLGTALAGQLLSFSERHPDIALYKLLGNTASAGKLHSQEKGLAEKNRAPMTRYRIFKELVKSSLPIRTIDLLELLHNAYPLEYPNKKIISSFSNHLMQLNRAGIITYKSINNDEPVVSFTKIDDRHSESQRTKSFYASHIDEIVASSESSLTYETTYDELIKRRPFYQNHEKKNVISRISSAYQELIRDGIVRQEGEFRVDIQSTITLTEEQYLSLHDFVEIIDRFRQLDPEFLAEGRRKSREIVSNHERFSALMKKARESSPRTGRKNRADVTTEVVAFIKDNPNCSNNDIQVYLANKGESYQYSRVNSITSYLAENGEVKAEKKGTKNYFSVSEEENRPNIQEGETVIFQPEID